MRWSVKTSLLQYISSLPDGHASITEGASLLGVLFHFPYEGSNGIDDSTGAAHLRFAGSVRLLGHFGLLNIPILNPWIIIASNGSGLVSLQGEANGGERFSALTFGASTFDTDAATMGWNIQRSRLTSDGTALFGHSYSTQDEFDPILVRITRYPSLPSTSPTMAVAMS